MNFEFQKVGKIQNRVFWISKYCCLVHWSIFWNMDLISTFSKSCFFNFKKLFFEMCVRLIGMPLFKIKFFGFQNRIFWISKLFFLNFKIEFFEMRMVESKVEHLWIKTDCRHWHIQFVTNCPKDKIYNVTTTRWTSLQCCRNGPLVTQLKLWLSYSAWNRKCFLGKGK